MSKHLKRVAIPRTWKIPKKNFKWVVKPSPGPHPIARSIPLLIVLRDLLGYCDTAREGKRILAGKEILVDGKVVMEPKYPIGLMDVVSVLKTKEQYRLVIDTRGKLRLVSIKESEAKWKLVRIANKTTLKQGKVQLNLHDGRNILIKKDEYKTGDVLKIELPSQKILDTYGMAEGNIAMLIGGKHVGEIASIVSYKKIRSPKPNIVNFKDFSTTKENVFVIGLKTPEIALPEVSAL